MRNEAPARQTVDIIQGMGRRALLVRANVGKLEDIDRLFETLVQEWGGLDLFINNAAIGFNRPGMQQKPSGWDGTMNVNARSFLFAAQKAAPLMEARGGGAMVAISSPGSVRVLPDYISVGASKAALEALVRYLAVELAPKHIAVNAVAPGMVETDALRYFSASADPDLINHATGTLGRTTVNRLARKRNSALALPCRERRETGMQKTTGPVGGKRRL